MKQIQTTPEQEKAMSYVIVDPQEWLQHAWDNRARQAIDTLVLDKSDKQPGKISVVEKKAIVTNAQIKTAKQREDEAKTNP